MGDGEQRLGAAGDRRAGAVYHGGPGLEVNSAAQAAYAVWGDGSGGGLVSQGAI